MLAAATLATVSLALIATACGGSSASDTTTPTTSRQTFFSGATEPYGKPSSAAPSARIPSTQPPRELTIIDLRKGTGPKVRPGDTAIVNYVGYHHDSKRRYDSSYGVNPLPYRVIPGRGDFIDGFEQGIVGMRVGGRRQVTIPPGMAYGDEGYSDKIAPGETLVFVIDLEHLERR